MFAKRTNIFYHIDCSGIDLIWSNDVMRGPISTVLRLVATHIEEMTKHTAMVNALPYGIYVTRKKKHH